MSATLRERYRNDPPTQHPCVRGRCPSCNGETLFLGSGGYVTCSVIGCKDPGAASDLLAAALAEREAKRPDAREIRRRTGIELDNHHNALACPYCNPDRLVLVSREEQKQAEARVSALQRELERERARTDKLAECAEKAERELEEARAERQRYVCELALQDDELARLREQLAAAQARLTRWLSDGCTDTDIEVPLDDYGKEVLKAALSALPGADPTKVER